MPIMQLEPGDMEAFKANYNGLIAAARVYYMNGEPSESMKQITGGLAMQNYTYAFAGVKKEWKAALHDKVFVATALLATVGAIADVATPEINKVNLNSTGYVPKGRITVAIKNQQVLNYLKQLQPKGNWVKVYEAVYIDGKQIEVHYFQNELTGQYYDSKIKQVGWSKQFLQGKHKVKP